jgi:all-trans-8'-apo-beta-carotenal 15,15'-oxygenase
MSLAALRQNLRRSHGFEPLEVEGKMPEDLRGTLYRAGVGVFERFGVDVAHPFEADGAITAVRFETSPLGASRVVESAGWREEEQAGRRLYGAGAGRLRNVIDMLRQRSKNTANTTAWVHDGELYALMEGARPTRLDPDTLDVLGEQDFDCVLGATFSAHPHRVASLQTSFNFGVRYGREHALDVYALPAGGKVRKLTSITLPWAAMVHDFIATERHLVFVVCPARVMILRALLGTTDFERLLEWEPERGVELIVVPLADPGAALRIPAEPFWVWHFANAFEQRDEIVVDLCRYADFGSLRRIRTGAGVEEKTSEPAKPYYTRLRIDPRTKRTREQLGSTPAEFPRVHPSREGAEHRFAFIHAGVEDERDAIGVIDVETGKLDAWRAPGVTSFSEPIPVPRGRQPDDERDVWLLTLGLDGARERSFVAVFDGQDVEQGPVARAWFDHPIPLTFHGTFVPA